MRSFLELTNILCPFHRTSAIHTTTRHPRRYTTPPSTSSTIPHPHTTITTSRTLPSRSWEHLTSRRPTLPNFHSSTNDINLPPHNPCLPHQNFSPLQPLKVAHQFIPPHRFHPSSPRVQLVSHKSCPQKTTVPPRLRRPRFQGMPG